MNKVFIAGIGMLSSLGAGTEETKASIDSGETGLVSSDEFGLSCGDISEFFDIKDYTETKYHYIDKTSGYTIAVIRMAMDTAGIDPETYDMYKAGLVIGTEWGCTTTMEMFQAKLLDSDPKFATPFLFSNSFPNSPAALASIEFGIKGYNTVYSGSDTSGLFAVMGAVDAVEEGKAETVFAVGVDALSQTTADYYGDSVSDGAACLVLTNEGDICIEGYSLSEADIPEADITYNINENTILGPEGNDLGFGNTMGAAFPIAIALAYEDLNQGKAETAIVHSNNVSGSLWISLTCNG